MQRYEKFDYFYAMRIYLLGYMASGKSRLGEKLAALTGMAFADIDRIFEQTYRITIPDFFEKYDENAFRIIERKLLLDTEYLKDTVIATGGGTPCFFDNMAFIRASGLSVYICWSVPELAKRLGRSTQNRPVLRNMPPEMLEEKIRQHLHERDTFYRQADLIVHPSGKTLEECAGEIREAINSLLTKTLL